MQVFLRLSILAAFFISVGFKMGNLIKHLDLFAGVGGFRLALETVAKDFGFVCETVAYSEINPKAIHTYKGN